MKAGDPEEAVVECLAHPGWALLDVKVNRTQPVMPTATFVRPEAVAGTGVYTANAMPRCSRHDIWEMVVKNTS